MSEENTVIEEARRKPLAERVEHKLWKVRVEAFEYIKSSCTKIVAEDDQSLTEFGTYGSLIDRMEVVDLGRSSAPSFGAGSTGSVGMCFPDGAVDNFLGPLLAKATTDTNAAALDKALEAMCEYLQKAGENHAARCGTVTFRIVPFEEHGSGGMPWTGTGCRKAHAADGLTAPDTNIRACFAHEIAVPVRSSGL